MVKTIQFFLVIENKKEEQARALTAIDKAFPSKSDAIKFGSFEGSLFWWRHTENEKSLTVVWIAKTMTGFNEVLRIALKQLQLTVVKREDIIILTDLMFPGIDESPDMPNGVSVVLRAVKEELVVAMCTDTNHHDAQFFQDLHPMLSQKAGYDIPYCVDAKDWDKMLVGALQIRKELEDLN